MISHCLPARQVRAHAGRAGFGALAFLCLSLHAFLRTRERSHAMHLSAALPEAPRVLDGDTSNFGSRERFARALRRKGTDDARFLLTTEAQLALCVPQF